MPVVLLIAFQLLAEALAPKQPTSSVWLPSLDVVSGNTQPLRVNHLMPFHYPEYVEIAYTHLHNIIPDHVHHILPTDQ